MIKTLVLSNFKQHGNRSFTFTEGLNLITGPNYSGKTTILYGILYALGGATHVPGTNIQKVGTNTGLSVEMEFVAGGDDYRVVRRKSGAHLYRGKEVLASGTTAVNERVEEILGMSMKRFRQLKYAEQKKAHALLTTGAAGLHELLDELTGVSQVNEAIDRLKDIVTTSAGALEVLTRADLAPIKEQIDRMEGDLLTGRQALAAEDLRQSEAQTEVSKQADAVTALEAGEREFNRIEALRNRLYAAADPLEERVKELGAKLTMTEEELTRADVTVKAMVYELERFREERSATLSAAKRRDEVQSKLGKLDALLQQTAEQIVTRQEKLGHFPTVLRDAVSSVEAFDEQHNVLVADRVAALGEMDRAIAAAKAAECPTCGRAYEGCSPVSEEVIEAYRLRAEALRIEIGRIKKLKEEAKDRLDRLRKDKSDLDAAYQRQIELAEQQRELESEHEILQETASRPLPDVEGYGERLTLLRDQCADECRYREELKIARGKLLAAREALEAAPPLPEYHREALTQARAALREAEAALDTSLRTVFTIRQENAMLEKLLGTTKGHLAKVTKENAEYDARAGRYANAKVLQKYLKDNRDRYASEVWEFFLATASEFVSNCTSGALRGIKRSDSGQFTYVEGGEEMGLKDASGAQEAIMGLGVQFALADAAMCPLDTLLVDEPTADMDPEHSMATTAMLASKGRQVIAISHREMDSSLCSNMITLGGMA